MLKDLDQVVEVVGKVGIDDIPPGPPSLSPEGVLTLPAIVRVLVNGMMLMIMWGFDHKFDSFIRRRKLPPSLEVLIAPTANLMRCGEGLRSRDCDMAADERKSVITITPTASK